MNYFSHPLDTKNLLRKKKSIKKELLNQKTDWICKNVAVLGGSTTKEVVDQLELFLLYHGIKPNFYQSEYGLYWEDAVYSNDELNKFMPDVVYIHTNWRNIKVFPSIDKNYDDVQQMLLQEYNRFSLMWKSLKEKFNCIIIQNNFDRPDFRLLGNRDISDFRGRSNYIFQLNNKFYDYAQKHNSFFINDIDYIAQYFGLLNWNDSAIWAMYKYFCNLNAIPILAKSITDIIKSIYGKNKKLLALDLDNTLWGGVIGDDGIDGIKIGKETPEGQLYYDFQKYCKQLKEMGVLLAINSKNDIANALEGLNHIDSVLKPDDFVSIKANWNEKNKNIDEISKELSLGIDTFVFVDDNPIEREIVKINLPNVEVPQIDSPENYIKIIDNSGFFENTNISKEDLAKTKIYQARQEALASLSNFKDYNEYLSSLEMKAIVTPFEPIYIKRITQLINKTNQFNLTTFRFSEDEVNTMQNSDNYICLCARLIDKFTDNGIVTVIISEIKDNNLYIRLWLMSCRVLKRNLENLMMNYLVSEASKLSINKIFGFYFPTQKNAMVKDFYKNMGFELLTKDEQNNTQWVVEVDKYENKKHSILLE